MICTFNNACWLMWGNKLARNDDNHLLFEHVCYVAGCWPGLKSLQVQRTTSLHHYIAFTSLFSLHSLYIVVHRCIPTSLHCMAQAVALQPNLMQRPVRNPSNYVGYAKPRGKVFLGWLWEYSSALPRGSLRKSGNAKRCKDHGPKLWY